MSTLSPARDISEEHSGFLAGAAGVTPVLAVCGVLLFAALLFLFRLGDRDLHSSHEARAAQNADMVLNEGHWGLPRLFDGRLELQKPPLYYWWIALVAWGRGGAVDAWAVRLPAALCGLLCVGFLMLFMHQRGRTLAGVFAGLVLASCPHFTWLARVGRIDMPLTLMVTVALGSFYLGRLRADGRAWFFLGYVAVALGLLLKGPIAAVLVFVVVLAHCVFQGRARSKRPVEGWWARAAYFVRGSEIHWGLPLVLVIAGPWFVWANYETGNELWRVFFWYHNIERGLGSETLASHPVWFYIPRLLLDLAPWSLLLPWAVVRALARPPADGLKPALRWLDAEARLGLVWLLAMTLFLSCMRFKRADYLLPAYPGAALLLGCGLESLWREAKRRRRLLTGIFLSFLASYLIGWGCYIHAEDDAGPSYRQLAAEIRQRTRVPVIFFRAEAHALAFHVGRPLDTILEWENLEVWANQVDPVYIVMPPDCADAWRQHLKSGHLDEVLRTSGNAARSERPLVVMCARPRS